MIFLKINISKWIVYIASAEILAYFTTKHLKLLRLVNSVAFVLFVLYVILISKAWPIIISNVAICVLIFIIYTLKKTIKYKQQF